jgi:ethanolamine utilization protein EutA
VSDSRRLFSSRGSLNSLTSVGIDIGTTSTHLVFSRLYLENQASSTQIPRLTVREREVLYQSPIYLTPLTEAGTIDGAGVAKLLQQEYKDSGFTSDDIDCGAVIITGETAMLRNAEQVLQEISSLAGDFVAASAGPELESILAGRGSGAMQYSMENRNTICNIDIGGGTTNIAIFHNGVLLETACLRIGGRSFRFNRDGSNPSPSQSGRELMRLSSVDNDFEKLGTCAANLIVNFLLEKNSAGKTEGDGALPPESFLMTPPLEFFRKVDEYWLSGGVAELVSVPEPDPFIYEDFGWFLAKGLKQTLDSRRVNYRIATNPVRATVLGAGSYSVQLSGNTVFVRTTKLPLKSVPIIRPFQNLSQSDCQNSLKVSNCIKRASSFIESSANGLSAAIVLELKGVPSYSALKARADVLADALISTELASPYILIVESDTAMALGQLLKGRLTNKELIVLDGIDFTSGDYLDIGKPLAGSTTIPVTVKSLIFAREH